MSEYNVNGKQTQIGDTVVFTDPWNGKHEATITKIEPKNGSHHATLELSTSSLKGLGQWFQDRAISGFRDVPHHKEGVPYSWDHVSD